MERECRIAALQIFAEFRVKPFHIPSMKQLLIIVALLCTFTFRSHAGDDPLTAGELARHLGIKSWVSKAHLQGADYNLEVIHVRDGKVVRSVTSAAVFATDREFTRFAILASQAAKGTKLSIQPEVGAKMTTEGEATISLRVILPLPRIIALGDYVLGGDVPDERLGPNQPPLLIEEIKDGLLLRVTKRA
jgi:hypothetical protein